MENSSERVLEVSTAIAWENSRIIIWPIYAYISISI